MTVARRSILAITSQVPWPLDRGGHLRSFHLLRGLARQYRVRLVAGVSAETRIDYSVFEQVGISFHPVYLTPRTRAGEARRAIAAALRREPYVCFRRHDHQTVRDIIEAELQAEEPDLVYLDHLDSLLFAGLRPSIPSVVDLHNVYSTLIRRTADETTLLRRMYLRRESGLLKRMETRAALISDALFVVSDDDRHFFRALGASTVHVIPNGVDCAGYAALQTGRRGVPPVILYVGTLSWGPNVAAARYLIEAILPAVRAIIPDARVRVVGRDPSPELLALGRREGVEITGAVDDVRPHLAAARVLAVPLEAGGGSRLKILEAFAAGLPVVSTVVGCEGLEVLQEVHLLIAPRSEFVQTIVRVLQDDVLADDVAANARALVRSQYDWESIGRSACDALSTLLGRASRG